jgi:hypothetical protein
VDATHHRWGGAAPMKARVICQRNPRMNQEFRRGKML